MITLPSGQNPLDALAAANAASSPVPVTPAEQLGPAAAPAPQMGQTTLSGDETGELPTSGFNMSFAQKMAQAADKLGIPTKADGTPEPGGWAKSLVAAAQSALAGVGNIGKVPEGAGGLYGAGKVLQYQAQQKQQAQERQDKLSQQAKENARLDQQEQDAHALAQLNIAKYHQESLDHSLSQDKSFADEKVLNEQKQQKIFTDSGASVIHAGLNSDEVQAQLAKNGIKSWQDHVFADGVQEYDKPDGTKGWRNTYSILTDPPNVTFDKDTADFINKNNPQNVPVQAGQQVTGLQARILLQGANSGASFLNAVEKTRTDADIEKMTEQQRDDALKLSQDAGMTKYAALAKGDPLKTISNAMSDPKLREKYPNLETDLKSVYFGDKEDPTGNKGYNEAIKEKDTNAMELEKARIAAGQNVSAAGGIVTDYLKNQLSKLTPDQQKLLSSYTPDEQGSLLAAAFGPGDIDFEKTFPNRLYKGQAGVSSQQAVRIVRELNPNWTPQQYSVMHKAYLDSTTGNMGAQIAQYNNVLEHGADAIDIVNSLTEAAGKDAPRFMRMGLNKLENAGYGTQVVQLRAGLQPVIDEFTALMANGYKPSEEEQTAYHNILSPDSTPEQIGAALKVIGATGAIRLENINQNYKRIAGQNLPGILTTDTMDAAKHINLDPTTMTRLGKLDVGGTLFHNPNWTPPTPAQQAVQQADQQATQAAQHVSQNVTPPANAQTAYKDPKTGAIMGWAVPTPDGKLKFQPAQPAAK